MFQSACQAGQAEKRKRAVWRKLVVVDMLPGVQRRREFVPFVCVLAKLAKVVGEQA
jgi:hypothetical protein